MTLNVFLEIKGKRQFVGRIEGKDQADASFSYAPEYCMDGRNVPVSVSLPLQSEPFSPEATRTFFEGLLPEGFTRRSVAQWMHVDEEDYLSILAGLGKECLGALQILDADKPDDGAAQYRPLSMEQVRRLAEEGSTRSASLVVASHLSLTGASGKVGLYYHEPEKTWYQPIGTAASTHIVKQSHVRLQNIVENEQLSLRTAHYLGIPVVDSFIINAGGFQDSGVLLASKRYDRMIIRSSEKLNGLPCPLRLHQEDMAQALGIPSTRKYEPDGDNYLQKIFRLLRDVSTNPLKDELRLLDLLIFDELIGNTDNHIKNLSLLYSPDLHTVRLAPAYDVICTLVYKESTSEMALSIGGQKEWSKINKQSFLDAAKDMGIGKALVKREYTRLKKKFPAALNRAAEELKAQGFPDSGMMKDRIAEAVGKND
ncbi:MAG: type II toxin-antitoxin system HipA family toxin [Eubacterium sp.]